VSRTYGVSIFIDYCTALATQRKVEGEERDIQLINMNEASSCLAWTGCLTARARRVGLIKAPPPPTHALPIAGF
jgi:hypothetical protein